MKDIIQLRNEIDALDVQLLDIVEKRLSLMPAIWQYKKEHSLPIYDPIREQEILEQKKNLAQQKGIDPAFTKALFQVIMNQAKKLQYNGKK